MTTACLSLYWLFVRVTVNVTIRRFNNSLGYSDDDNVKNGGNPTCYDEIWLGTGRSLCIDPFWRQPISLYLTRPLVWLQANSGLRICFAKRNFFRSFLPRDFFISDPSGLKYLRDTWACLEGIWR